MRQQEMSKTSTSEPAGQGAGPGTFAVWGEYFEANLVRHARLDAQIPWASRSPLPSAARVATSQSLQRFELGERGEGTGLMSKAAARGDADYDAALVLFVQEEQKHSALFARALKRFGVEPLAAHWSDGAFVVLRRLMGLRTEITLFLVAETVALEYFGALHRSLDPVIHGVAERVLTDEVEHIRFQIDQLRVGFERVSPVGRMLAAAAAWTVAVGAATVVALDHGPALRACGLRPFTFWGRALRHFRLAAGPAFRLGRHAAGTAPYGPTSAP
ncbi:ferritin-like domain-containing protein [Herbiconiux sp. UC225_62]|uniref:ferritin-like domain-containing protein n=1 Tax=Herbiconiux sp. UC225_62 TaxID=3350168 RepID=UPI0036D3B588